MAIATTGYTCPGMSATGWWGIGGVIGMILMIVIIGGGILLFVELTKKKSSDANGTPLEIAYRRYASGEITYKQLEDIKKEIKH